MTDWWLIKLRVRYWLVRLLPHRCRICHGVIWPGQKDFCYSGGLIGGRAYHKRCLIPSMPRKGIQRVELGQPI